MASSNPHYEADTNAVVNTTLNGKQTIMVKPRGLNIVWGRDERYWVLPKKDDEPAELLQVCWLEVTGSVEINTPKDYVVKFEVSLTPDAFGWVGSPIYIMVKRGKNGKPAWKKKFLTNDNGTKDIDVTVKKPGTENQGSTDPEKLYFGLYEVWSGKWKGGLKIHHVEVTSID